MNKRDRQTLADIEQMLVAGMPWIAIAKKYKRTLAGIRYYYASLRKTYLTHNAQHEEDIRTGR